MIPGSDGVMTFVSDIIVDICVIDDHPFVIVQGENLKNDDSPPGVSLLLDE